VTVGELNVLAAFCKKDIGLVHGWVLQGSVLANSAVCWLEGSDIKGAIRPLFGEDGRVPLSTNHDLMHCIQLAIAKHVGLNKICGIANLRGYICWNGARYPHFARAYNTN
jgi:hypothetical protein